jgi:EAL domain-containing protein (putative c-di-GMP-specific phosphodiesterase class I)/CRP-like cAMP-binding protein
MPDLKQIQDDALLAISAGNWIAAAELYATLEEREPGAGTWSLRLGECLRQAGQGHDAVVALTRGVQAYVQCGNQAKAAAICQQILEIDPHNAHIRAILDCLGDLQRPAALPDSAFQPPAPAATAPVGAGPAQGFGKSDLTLLAEDPLAAIDSTGATHADAQPAEIPSEPPTAARAQRPRVVLPVTPFFSALSDRQVRWVNARAHLLAVGPGEILYAAGEPSNALFLVASGEIAVLVPQEVARLQRGDFFGEEVVVLPGHGRIATMRATAPSQILALEGTFINELVSAAPALLGVLSTSLRERLIVILARISPVLASLPESDRLALLQRFRLVDVDEDHCICEPDAAGAGLSLLLAGEADAALDGRLTERLHPGDVFGEIPLVTKSAVGIRVMARAKCFVLQLPKAEFESVRTTWPRVVDYLTALAENRLARLEQAVVEDSPVFQSVPLPPRILVIHGDPETRSAYERALGEAGFLVDAAGEAVSASDMITNRTYDVVLYNLDSSEQAGTDVLRNIRRHDLDVPIILTTRYSAFDHTSATANYSVVRGFPEPLDVADLVRAASRAVHFHRLTRLRREAMTRLNSSGEWLGDRAGLEFHFDRALGCLHIAFQPIVSAVDNSVFAFEALLRSGEELLCSPLAVLRAAERLNRVQDVGRIARDSIAAVLAGSADPPILFVNVHSHDLLDPHLLDPDSLISRFAPRIVLQITERTPLDELSNLRARIMDLRALGYRFALDNLGAGHAGVASLAQLEPEVCKLDASLIHGIDRDSVRQDLVRAMLAVCRDMNILTICEGVATLPERHALVQLGADLMQGDLFGKPGPAFPSVDFSTIGRTP